MTFTVVSSSRSTLFKQLSLLLLDSLLIIHHCQALCMMNDVSCIMHLVSCMTKRRLIFWLFMVKDICEQEYQPSGIGGTRSLPATPCRLQNPKWLPGGPKMADGVWKGAYSWVLWALANFWKIIFLIQAFLLWENVVTEEKKRGEEKKKRRLKIVATTSLPAVNRPNAD